MCRVVGLRRYLLPSVRWKTDVECGAGILSRRERAPGWRHVTRASWLAARLRQSQQILDRWVTQRILRIGTTQMGWSLPVRAAYAEKDFCKVLTYCVSKTKSPNKKILLSSVLCSFKFSIITVWFYVVYVFFAIFIMFVVFLCFVYLRLVIKL